MCLDKMLQIWKSALMKPKMTFKKEVKKADLGLGAKHILLAGAIVGLLMGIASLNPIVVVILLFLYPILSLVGWLLGVGIIYLFAKLLGGKGNIVQQGYLTAIYAAPLSIITTILSLIPFVGIWISILVSLYAFYLLTLALKEVHKYSTGRAILTWLMPFIIIGILVAVLVAVVLVAFVTSSSSGIMPDISQLVV